MHHEMDLLKPGLRLTRPSLADSVGTLAKRDPDLRRLVQQHGPPPLWARPAGFATLARIILEQQVSLASAAAVYARVGSEIPGGWTPESLLQVGVDGLRARGITRQKAAYLEHLAGEVTSGSLSLASLSRASDTDVVTRLTRLRGIGPWTASIYLLMALRRPDVWPTGDLALHIAMGRARGLRRPPTSEEAARYARRWAPHRATAARILWHSYLARAAAS